MTDTLTEALDLTAHRGTDSMMQHPCSPGSHPHSDRPNWQPAETANDYLRNCQDGLEAYTDRRMAKIRKLQRRIDTPRIRKAKKEHLEEEHWQLVLALDRAGDPAARGRRPGANPPD